jgi:hypothetical protein
MMQKVSDTEANFARAEDQDFLTSHDEDLGFFNVLEDDQLELAGCSDFTLQTRIPLS